MKIITKEVPDSFNIFHVGDDHEGTTLRHDKGWNKMCDMIESEYDGIKPEHNYATHSGDHIEAIMLDDTRYDMKTTKTPLPALQNEYAVLNIKPIANHFVVALEGNHPLKLWKYGDLTQMWCDAAGMEYGTYSCKIRWVDKNGKVIFKSFHTHGRKGISSTADDPERRQSNMRLILKRQLKEKMGDCVLMTKGHVHRLLMCSPTPSLYMADDGREITSHYTAPIQIARYIHPDHRWYVNTGSFLRLYGRDVSGYGEIAEYDPIETGFAITKVRDRQIVDVVPVVI